MVNDYIMQLKCSNYTKGQLIVFLKQLQETKQCISFQEYSAFLDNFIKTLDPQKLNELQRQIDEVIDKSYINTSKLLRSIPTT